MKIIYKSNYNPARFFNKQRFKKEMESAFKDIEINAVRLENDRLVSIEIIIELVS